MALRTEQDLAWGLKIYGWLESEILTEENTDMLVDVVAKWVPVIPSALVRPFLDRMMPELALDAAREAMQRLGWLRDSDVFLEPDNPFRGA